VIVEAEHFIARPQDVADRKQERHFDRGRCSQPPSGLYSSMSETGFFWSLYTLMFVLPLAGWGMLSAGHYPIVMYGPLHLPPILPANPAL